MLCDNCGKNQATYFSRTSINGIITEKHLCNECLKSENFGPMLSFGEEIFEDYDFIPDAFDLLGFNQELNDKNLINQALKSVNIGAKNRELNSKKDSELETLKQELKDAVDREDYETASAIKKKIDSLNNEPENKGE